MSYKEVSLLRKEGKLEEALTLAQYDLEQDPNNIWAMRAASWVYYEYLKNNLNLDSFDTFVTYLTYIRDLDLSENEKMLFDNCAWKIGKVVFELFKQEVVNYNRVDVIFDIIKDFHFTRPSKAFSFLNNAFYKGATEWEKYPEFIEWWDLNNFDEEDYEGQVYNDRKNISLVEKVCIAYSKILLIKWGLDIDHLNDEEKLKLEKSTTNFFTILDSIIVNHPEYTYVSFYKAKLLLATHNKEKDILKVFLPFAKQKRNDFWVWDLLADINEKDASLQFACYCKALDLKTNEDFLVKLRAKFTKLLIDKKWYNEAKTEIQLLIKTREKNSWRIPQEIVEWTKSEWYKTAIANKNNRKLYAEHIEKAEEILYQDIPEEIIVVEFVNYNKKILNFVKDKQKRGFFNYSNILLNPKIGDILSVRFNDDGKNNFYKTLTVKNCDTNTETEVVKAFIEQVSILGKNSFGFADKIYISDDLIKLHKIENGNFIKGKAMISFNKKKDEWGWKAININDVIK